MRVLLARVSILSVCILAVSAAPARGQSPTLTGVPPLVRVTSSSRPADGQPPALGAGTGQNQKDEKPAPSPGDPKAPIKPRHEDFATPEAYEAAKDKYYEDLTDYKVKQATTAEKQRADDLERRLAALEGQKKTQDADAVQNQTQGAGAGPNQTPGADVGQNQAESAKSEPKIKIFGAVKLDAIFNTARPQAPGVPFFLVPKFPGGFSQRTLDINARQSLLGVLFTGPDIGKFHSGGRISAVFFDPAVVTDTYGFLLQQSYAELFNDHWRFAAGLQFDVFAPGLPTDLSFSYLGGAGSTGNCIRGQFRVERFVNVGSDQWTFQGAISQPLNTVVTPDVTTDEDNGWPNLEGRIGFGKGKPAPIGIGLLTQRPLEVGVSGVVGQLRRTAAPFAPPRRVVSDVWGVAVDFRMNLADRFGFKGDVYSGQALGNYNGAILQSLDAVTWKAIRSTGGFVEGFVYLTPRVHSHTGIGIDDPNNNDITPIPNTLFGRTYNRTVYSTLLWDVNMKFRLGFEFTYRKTEYKDPIATGRLPNEGFGFQPQFAWSF